MDRLTGRWIEEQTYVEGDTEVKVSGGKGTGGGGREGGGGLRDISI